MLIVFAVIVIVGLVGMAFNRDLQLKRRIRKLPKSSIAETPEDTDVRVCGDLEYVEDLVPLTAPLSGRECVAWRVIVRERRSSGKNSRWVTVVEEESAIDFMLVDATGRARIDGTALSLALDVDASGGTGLFKQDVPRLEAFLGERGISTRGFIFGKTLQYKEGILALGEKVTVAGSAKWEKDPTQRGQGGYRDVGKLLRVRALATGELLATDDKSISR